jgi:predicted double-glycine peptidase
MKRWHLWIFLVTLTAALPVSLQYASDRSKNHAEVLEAEKKKAEARIPDGAIKIPLPSIEQPDGYSCGAASLMSICMYFGVGAETISEFKKKVHTTRADGTYYLDMVDYARRFGLNAEAIPDMTPAQLEENVGNGKPVICSIQAYGKPEDYVRNDKDNGHYVVAIGFDEDNFYFMDPYRPAAHRQRGYIPKKEFPARWHDDEAKTGQPPNVINHLGIVVSPKEGQTPFLHRAMKIP